MSSSRLWCSDLGNGTFQNPILYADYSDPDVIRVDDTFYMTASSFNYIPGLPILVSKDLVNWELKNYAIKERLPYDTYDLPAHAKGIWAPSIRYHNGLFYIFVGMPDEGIFVLTAADPLGDWSEPQLLLPGKGYIDPCPVWLPDGTAYVVHGYAKSRIGFKSILGIFEMSPDGMTQLSEDTFLYDGTQTNPTIEGPKLYLKNGYFYIFAPAGGVKSGWQTVLRSKSLFGPYEEKIVLHQGSSDINGPHQGALVDTPSGEEWFLHFQDAGVYGRITHMQPVLWKNDWPVIGKDVEGIDCGEPQHTYPKPSGVPKDLPPLCLAASDDFSADTLGLQWQWLANSRPEFYSLTAREHALRLYSHYPKQAKAPILWNCAHVLTQKLVCPAFAAEFTMDFSHLKNDEMGGIIMMGGEYAALAFRRRNDITELVYLVSETIQKEMTEPSGYCHTVNKKTEKELFSTLVDSIAETAVLRLTFAKDRTCQMSWRLDGETDFTDLPMLFAPSGHTWVGAKIGMFSTQVEHHEFSGFTDVFKVSVNKIE